MRTTGQVPTYTITVGMPLGEYVMEVPTDQGIDAAKRRARMTAAWLHPTVDLSVIVVMDAKLLLEQNGIDTMANPSHVSKGARPMTDAQTKAYRAWQKAANPSDATMRRESNIADFERRNARVRKLKAAYEASSQQQGECKPPQAV
jgi:hypothetical protein